MKNLLKFLGGILAIPFIVLSLIIKLILLFVLSPIVALLTGNIDIYRRFLTFVAFVIKDIKTQLKQDNKLTYYKMFTFRTSSEKNMTLTRGCVNGESIYEIKEESEQKS